MKKLMPLVFSTLIFIIMITPAIGSGESIQVVPTAIPDILVDSDDFDLRAGGGNKVLVLDGALAGSTLAIDALLANGYDVTDGGAPSSYTGSPDPSDFDLVMLLMGDDYSDDMPVAGQTAIENFVDNGGPIIMTEWVGYHVQNGRYTIIAPMVPMEWNGGNNGVESCYVLMSHPITQGIPNHFAGGPHNVGVMNLNAGATVVVDGSLAINEVAFRSYGSGMAVHFATVGKDSFYDAWADADLLQLLLNSADWLAKKPKIWVDPTSFDFTLMVGQTETAFLTIANDGLKDLYYNITPTAQDWLSISPLNGTLAPFQSMPHTVIVNSSGLSGFYQADIIIQNNDPNENPVTIPVNLTVIEITWEIPLQEGWNLISLPFIQDDTAIDEVLVSIWDKWDAVMIYDPLNPTPWISNIKTRHWSLNDLWELDHTMGIWINITEPGVNLTVNGSRIPSTIQLLAGWNLVGYPNLVERNISDALAGTGYDRVNSFNASAPYRISQLADTYLMKPGEGYWVHVPADTVWTVDW